MNAQVSELVANDVVLATNEDGYLLDPLDWTPEVAELLASRDGLTLTEDHWYILNFMRDYYEEHLIAADARFVVKYLATEGGHGRNARAELYRLFPYGYMQQTCKIAGMRRPRAWSTG